MTRAFYQVGGQGWSDGVPAPVQAPRNPSTSAPFTDLYQPDGTPYQLTQFWINTTTDQIFQYEGAGVWVVSASSSGSVDSLTDTSGTVVNPLAGNIQIAGTTNQVASTAGTNKITLSLPSAIIAPGSITSTTSTTSGTTLTASLGAITASNGNLVLGTAGNKIVSISVASTTSAGANSFGTVTLAAGTATVSTTAVTANSIIILTRQSVGATGAAALGQLTIGTVTAGTSFVINAALTATATSLATTDVSVVGWMIIN